MPTGWEGSDRRRTLPDDWAVRQLTVLRRDHHRCQHIRIDTERRCLRQARDVDHIIPNSQGGTDDYSNLMALCSYHHSQKSGREGGIASGKAKRARAEKARPMHPGLMPAPEPVRDDGPAPF